MNLPSTSAGPISRVAEPPPLPEILEVRRERRLAAGFAVVGAVVFAVAAGLNPYDEDGRPRSHGTHRQLGLPPCAMKIVTGIGCPSCGMTTTFSLLMHGDHSAAWRANWAGCVVAGLALIATGWFAVVAVGFPPGRLTADEVVKMVAVIGTGAAVMRWLAVTLAAS